MSSRKKIKQTLPENSEILSVTRKEHSLVLSRKKFLALTQVTRRFVQAENFFLKNFAGIEGLKYLRYPKALRDQFVQRGLPQDLAQLGLQARQWKMALDAAFDTIKSSHALTCEEVKKSVNRSASFNDAEKHLIRFLLRSDLLYFVCIGKFNEVIPTVEKLDFWKSQQKNSKKVLIWLRRRYRECHSKHNRSEIRSFRTYHVDQNMFSFFQEKGTCYFSVASLIPNRRIAIPLTNSSLKVDDFYGNLKVVLKKNGKVEIHRTINTVVPKCDLTKERIQTVSVHSERPLKIVGLDKGLKALLHTDQETSYGNEYSQKFVEWSDELTQVNSGRARFHSLVQNLKADLTKTRNPHTRKKIQGQIVRIQKNNLSTEKISRKREWIHSKIKKEIGTAVNRMFSEEKPDVLIAENLKFISFKNLGKRTNRLLNTWSKGALRDALELGAKKNGVLLEEVNAAFTSQYCRHCFFVDSKNRCGAVFACKICFYKENADFAAAKNVKDRFFDPEIGVYTPVKEVKAILLKRHRVRLSTLGLNQSVRRCSSANDQETSR